MKNEIMPSIWRLRRESFRDMLPVGFIVMGLFLSGLLETVMVAYLPKSAIPSTILGLLALYCGLSVGVLLLLFFVRRTLYLRTILHGTKTRRAFKAAKVVLPLVFGWKKRRRILDGLTTLQQQSVQDVLRHYIGTHSSLWRIVDHLYLEETLVVWSRYYLKHTREVDKADVIQSMMGNKSLIDLYSRCLLTVFGKYDVTRGNFTTFWNEVHGKDEESADLFRDMIASTNLRDFAQKFITDQCAAPFLEERLRKIRNDYRRAEEGSDVAATKMLNHRLMALYLVCYEWELEDLRLLCLSEVNFKLNKLFKAEREAGNPPLSAENRLLILKDNNF